MAGSRKRLKVDWYKATEQSSAHAWTRDSKGRLVHYSMCGLPLDNSFIRADAPKCALCQFAISRNMR